MSLMSLHTLFYIGALVDLPVTSYRMALDATARTGRQLELDKAALLEYGITDLDEPDPVQSSSMEAAGMNPQNGTADTLEWPRLLSAVMKQSYKSFGKLWTLDGQREMAHFRQLVSNQSGYNILVLAAGQGVMTKALLSSGLGTHMKVVNTDYDYLHGGTPGILSEYLNEDGNTKNDQLLVCGADNTDLASNPCIKNFTDNHGEFDLVLMNNGMCSHGDFEKKVPMRICGGCAEDDLPGFFKSLTAMTRSGGTWMFINLNTLMTIEEGRNEPPEFFKTYLHNAGYAPAFQYKEYTGAVNGMPWTWVQTVSK